MSAAAPAVELPDDPAQLKALLRAERALRAELVEEVARLEAIVAAFRRAMFGRRSEKLDPGQLELALEDAQQELAEARAESDAADAPLRAVRTARRRAHRRTCRGSRSWSSPGAWPAPAVAVGCTRSARTSPNVSTSSRHSSGCW